MKWPESLGSLLSLSLLLAALGCAESQRGRGSGAPPENPADAALSSAPASGNPAYGAYPAGAEPPPLQNSAPPPPPPPAATSADHEVAGAIYRMLNGDDYLAPSAKNVTAKVNKGVVTLRGTVPSEHGRDEIGQRIRQLPGVDRVDNQLQLEGRY